MNTRQTTNSRRKLHQLFVDDIVKENDLRLAVADNGPKDWGNKSSKRVLFERSDNTPHFPPNAYKADIIKEQQAASAGNKVNQILTKSLRKGDTDQAKRNTHSKCIGQVVQKVTIYDTWYVIGPPQLLREPRHQQRNCLHLPLVKLANSTARMKLPSPKWSSKVTLYKVMPCVLQRHTLTIFTGDLKAHKISEKDRHKYQPSCVIFRRSAASTQLSAGERSNCHVPYDRILIFKNKYFTVNFDGKHVNLNGAPDAVTCIQDIKKLLDIVDYITLSNSMIEIVSPK